MDTLLKKFLIDKKGATIVEYSVVALIITFAIFSSLSFVGTTGSDVFNSISSAITDADKKSNQTNNSSSAGSASQNSAPSEKTFIY